LDEEWKKIEAAILERIEKSTKILRGKDAKAVKDATLASKVTLLYALMDEYDKQHAFKIQELADEISKDLKQMKDLQMQAEQYK
jgi:hypothetical protein